MKALVLRSIREGTLQLWRNKFLSSTTILLGALIIFLLNFVFAIAYYTDLTLQNLESRADFNIPLATDISDYQFLFGALENELNQNFNINLARLEPETYSSFSVPPRLNITFSDLSEVEPVLNTIKKVRYADLLGQWDGTSERDFVVLINKLVQMRASVDEAAFWLIIVFTVGGVLLMINAFRIVLFSRREELRLARLVGADTSFIAGPYLWEAWLMGLLSSVVGVVVFILILREVDFLPQGDIFLHLWNTRFTYEILGAGLVSVLGAWISIRKYLGGSFKD